MSTCVQIEYRGDCRGGAIAINQYSVIVSFNIVLNVLQNL